MVVATEASKNRAKTFEDFCLWFQALMYVCDSVTCSVRGVCSWPESDANALATSRPTNMKKKAVTFLTFLNQ